jgi:phage terminase large subunit
MRVQGAEKGSDSIMNGIQKMQGVKFSVTKRSTNLIKELDRYKWAVDKDGRKLNRPIDNWNHAIDGIRYYFTTKDKYSGRYVVADY